MNPILKREAKKEVETTASDIVKEYVAELRGEIESLSKTAESLKGLYAEATKLTDLVNEYGGSLLPCALGREESPSMLITATEITLGGSPTELPKDVVLKQLDLESGKVVEGRYVALDAFREFVDRLICSRLDEEALLRQYEREFFGSYLEREAIRVAGEAQEEIPVETPAVEKTDDYLVFVCEHCHRSSCWIHEFACDKYRESAGIVKRASELRRLGLEHESWYSRETILKHCGSVTEIGDGE